MNLGERTRCASQLKGCSEEKVAQKRAYLVALHTQP